jgi:hypothetical protein
MKRSIRTVAFTAAAAASMMVASPLAGAQPAPTPSPESAPPGPEPEGQYCVILADKPADPTAISNEVFSACSDTDIGDAEAQLRAAESDGALAQRGASIQAAIPIMRWSENLNNTSPYTVIYGSAGPCDINGYNLNPNSYWASRISSMQGYNYCNIADMRQNIGNQFQSRLLPLNYVGDPWNDNIGFIKVHS